MTTLKEGYEHYTGPPVQTGQDGVEIVLTRRPPMAEVTGRIIDAQTKEPVTEFGILALGGSWSTLNWITQGKFKPVSDQDGRCLLETYEHEWLDDHCEGGRLQHALLPILGDGRIACFGSHARAGTSAYPAGCRCGQWWLAGRRGRGIHVRTAAPEHLDGSRRFGIGRESGGTDDRLRRGGSCWDSVPGDAFLLTAFHADHGLGRLEVGPSGKRPSQLRITLKHGGRVEGMATIGGAPMAGGRVSIRRQDLRTGAGGRKDGRERCLRHRGAFPRGW